MGGRRIIAFEEHFLDPAAAGSAGFDARSPGFAEAFHPSRGLPYAPAPETLRDLGEGRLADMDAHGISVQVLSGLHAQNLPIDVAAGLTRGTNDLAAAAVARHPERFAAFAVLPTADPAAAVAELTRCVEELGFVGALVHGRTGGEFLSASRFSPILERLAALRVPLYLHPAPPPLATSASNYDGFDPVVTARLQTAAWGWHAETAVHFLNLYLAGVFDRHPALQVILGHWGELLPFYMERIDEALPPRATGLERTFVDVMRRNVFVTPSGMWTQANLDYCVAMLGIERILFAVDYPFLPNDGAAPFIESARLTGIEKDLVAHGNAERLLARGAHRRA
ncbi:MAG: amidohydrolase [Candidatus Leucobacter sulfamidivorax]|nr:amidohydrolase [Candidatus Leucobacter sulfamidivorax]